MFWLKQATVGFSNVSPSHWDCNTPRQLYCWCMLVAGGVMPCDCTCSLQVVSTSRTPGHTKHFQTIFLTPNVRLCDSPGLVFPSLVDKQLQVLCDGDPLPHKGRYAANIQEESSVCWNSLDSSFYPCTQYDKWQPFANITTLSGSRQQSLMWQFLDTRPPPPSSSFFLPPSSPFFLLLPPPSSPSSPFLSFLPFFLLSPPFHPPPPIPLMTTELGGNCSHRSYWGTLWFEMALPFLNLPYSCPVR